METNGSFPDDLVSEILSWLPVRQLLRFRCVSKSWCALVDNPTFINKHHHTQYAILKKEQGHIPIFLHDIRGSFTWYLDLSYSSEDLATRLHFVSKTYDDVLFLELEGFSSRSNHHNAVSVECIGYANGVFLFEWHIRFMHSSYLGLWNPATREFKFVPSVPGSCREYWGGSSALGFDSMSNDFKIIQLISRVTEGVRVYYACEMYSLKTNSWKSIEYPSHPEHNLSFGPIHSGVHINSIYYWPYSTIHHRRVPQSQESNFILSFDFCNEIFQFLSQPRIDIDRCFLANYNGSLACISCPNIPSDIWVMSKVDDHGIPSAWQHLFAIEPFPGKFGCFCSLWVGSDMLLSLADIPVPNNDDPYGSDDEAPHSYSCLYDPAAKRITKRFEFVLGDRFNYEYVESLWKLTNSTKSI